MNDRVKKIIIVTLFTAAVITMAYLIYYYFFKPSTTTLLPSNFNQNQNLPSGQLPLLNEGGVNRIGNTNAGGSLPSISQLPEGVIISETAKGGYTRVNSVGSSKIASPQLNTSGGFNYFNSSEGRFYKINADGTASQLSGERFYAVQKVTWAPGGNSAVLEYPDGSNIVYDFNKNQQFSLPKELENFAFSSGGSELAAAAMGQTEENNWIVTANPDGSNIQFVERLGANGSKVDINWSPNGQMVAMYKKNVGVDAQEIIFVGRNEENFQSLTVNGSGFVGKWAPKGNRLLYSVYRHDNDLKPILQSVIAGGDNTGSNNIDLGLATWPNKCSIGQDGVTAYCGVPDYLPKGAGLYPVLANDSSDVFYKVNLATGEKFLLAQPVGDVGSYSADKVFLSPDEKTLYFQDTKSGRMYSIKL